MFGIRKKMSASEAEKIAKKSYVGRRKTLECEVLAYIKRAAKKGLRSTCVIRHYDLLLEDCSFLLDLGYKVEHRPETTKFRIDW